jgi:hypothetical protein
VHSLYRRKKALGSLKALVSRPLTVSKSDVKSFAGLIYFSAKALMLKRKLDASWKENLVEQPAELVM